MDLLTDASAGTIDTPAVAIAFLLACMFALMLAVILGEADCTHCGHTNYQHDDSGCAGKDTLGNYARDCNCRGFRS